MPTSEARIAANRLNASKSTGPRTPEGKARSRANARTHGLTGEGIAVPDEDAAIIAERFAALQEQLAPRNLAATVLVQRIAMLSVRLDRCYRHEANALSARVDAARPARIAAREADAAELIRTLADAPITNARRLRSTPEGVDALIARWEELQADLDDPRGPRWTDDHVHRANALNGIPPDSPIPTPYTAWTEALKGDFSLVPPVAFPPDLTDLECRQLALLKLVARVEADLAEIRAFRATMDTAGRDADLARAPKIALFDPSHDAILARKYEAAAERGLYKALDQLRQIQAGEEIEVIEDDEDAELLASFSPVDHPDLPTDPAVPSPYSRRSVPDPKAARKRSRKPR